MHLRFEIGKLASSSSSSLPSFYSSYLSYFSSSSILLNLFTFGCFVCLFFAVISSCCCYCFHVVVIDYTLLLLFPNGCLLIRVRRSFYLNGPSLSCIRFPAPSYTEGGWAGAERQRNQEKELRNQDENLSNQIQILILWDGETQMECW